MKFSTLALSLIGSFAIMMGSCTKEQKMDIIIQEPEPEPESKIEINESELIGTWEDLPTSSTNKNYYAFDGKGSGMYSFAAEQYEYECYNPNGSFSLVRFRYKIEGNIIQIYPQTTQAPFSLEIDKISGDKMNGYLQGAPYYISKISANKISSSPNWFIEYGPASDDLTIDLTGAYICDQDSQKKCNVERINNYTLKITFNQSGTVITGYLHRRDKFDPTMIDFNEGRRWLWRTDDSHMSSDYYFTPNGKLNVNGSYDTYSIQSTGNNDNEESKAHLAGTRWGGKVDEGYLLLDFKTNGTFIETYNGESDQYKYEESGNQLITEEGCILNNTFGDIVNFTIDGGTLTLKNKYETWILTKKL